MKIEQVIEALSKNGFIHDETKDIGHGKQARFTNGAIVNVYDSGIINRTPTLRFQP